MLWQCEVHVYINIKWLMGEDDMWSIYYDSCRWYCDLSRSSKMFVGDPNQQIYSFRGASNAFDQIQATNQR